MGQRHSNNSIFTRSLVPGPGSYVPVNVTFTSPKFSIKGRHKVGTSLIVNQDGSHEKVAAASDSNVPGPGTYSVKTSQVFANLSTKFGSETRPSMGKFDAARTPAPGSYNAHPLKQMPSYGFGASKRPGTTGTEYVPGPGTYKAQQFTGKETVGKTLGKKLEQIKTTNLLSPGPGTYNTRLNQTAPTCRMGSSTRDDIDRNRLRACNFPPPDSYNPLYQTTRER